MNLTLTFLDPVKALIEMVFGSLGTVMVPSAPAFSSVYTLYGAVYARHPAGPWPNPLDARAVSSPFSSDQKGGQRPPF
jgi:hypothetical protein